MKKFAITLIALTSTVCSYAVVVNGLNGANGGIAPVPDSSSSALLLGIAVVTSLLVGRKFIKK